MKTYQHIFLLAAMIFSFAACEKQPEDQPDPDTPKAEAPVITLETSVIEADAQGGRFTIGYSIENPVEGGEIEAHYTADWLTGFQDKNGTLHFGIYKNETGSEREAQVEISYPGIEKPYPVFTVRQRAEGEDPSVKKYKVGDLYENGNVKGIVFKVDETGEHGKILSLTEHTTVWSLEYVDLTLQFGPFSMEDGYTNTKNIKEIENWKKNYPSFKWCDEMNLPDVTAWYMPAIWEMSEIYTAYTGEKSDSGDGDDNISQNSAEETRAWFNKCLTDAGGTPLSDEHYSSTQYGAQNSYAFRFIDGEIETDRAGNQKDNKHHIRAVRAF